ncbi:ABC transporter permease [Rhodovulum viride]|uniref:ABC transporter permease n=1 Tax=Rhodovulum viride TaxID=1231134 RepID=A0ABX9DJG1_9RHOB|nr:iron ABC transporter permease [Rhodovulum viride]RAP42526.1 ABC transporter permease [Rhodovulum viride]
MTAALANRIAAAGRARARRRTRIALGLGVLLCAGVALVLISGPTLTPLLDVLRVLAGGDVPGASFAVRELRLPRAVLAVLAGMSFGLGGAAFQTMLRNPLASPDIVGITAGGSAAAVFAIVVLGWRGPEVSVFALAMGLAAALAIYLLSWRNGVAGARLILIGIAISAMLDSAIAYILSIAPTWTLQEAMRWLAGSLNGVQLAESGPLLAALVVFGGLLLALSRDLEALRLGDDKAAALGVRLGRTRLLVTLAAVGLIAVATSVTGPIAFVAFLSGPIAARLAGPDRSVLIPAALIGAGLVLAGDFAGQSLLPSRYPVGVVTGVLGAPYLLYLIIRVNRGGGSM